MLEAIASPDPRTGDMAESLDHNQQLPNKDGTANADGRDVSARAPICFVVDEDSSIRRFLSLILHGSGLDTEELTDPQHFQQALSRRLPDLVFLNIGLETAAAIKSLAELGKRRYPGFVQLISNRGSAVLEHVKSVGEQHLVKMLPVLKKPFEASTIVAIVQQLKLGHSEPQAARVDLGEALAKRWIEFWYQPKIDLRKKRLVGVEAFVRCRHPQNGVLLPSAFMPGAKDSELLTLSEVTITSVLNWSQRLMRLGVNIRCAVNIPLATLVNLPVVDLVRPYVDQFDQWQGLIIDVTEEQIITELALATELTKKFADVNAKLAIDHFGRGYSTLARFKDLPFAELKLDQAFITDCGTDKVKAPLCKSAIDLAHGSDCLAVAVGIEKASDAVALTSMGCDIGQGFLLGLPMPEERFMSLLRQRAAGQGKPLPAAANA
jgi:EAL domain-containing protein (putative c-di-GMP-specific phosphodiesterase class I)/CheY-like chemotaxis protein